MLNAGALVWFVIYSLVVYIDDGYGQSTIEEPTTQSVIERKMCGNVTNRQYCPNTGCCIDKDRVESCCYLMQTSEWCPLYNGSDVYCDWGCCYHDEDKICCSFLTMKYSFLLIVAAILVSYLVVVLFVSCLSHCLTRCYHCSWTDPNYSRTY